ncbi:hypothetical protein AAHA92_07244 [Salvia divinorum]|uniref:Uncharacterized protein n=1 Tax=Salvia divinorum TaxID=28513 RepID=A0ABD1I8B8_SALDI
MFLDQEFYNYFVLSIFVITIPTLPSLGSLLNPQPSGSLSSSQRAAALISLFFLYYIHRVRTIVCILV